MTTNGIHHSPPKPKHATKDGNSRVWVGDCRPILATLPEVQAGKVDLVFADPPFNWNRGYDKWNDAMPRQDYLAFTREWLDVCRRALRPGGAFWINIPDDTCAEIVMHLKAPGADGQPALEMENWCIWHYRFGQNTREKFISSKVHALYFVKPGGLHENAPGGRTWRPERVLEATDRATTYFDPRTFDKKDGMPGGKRVPLDVWYGPYWGRIQGNNKERRPGHDNQLPEVYLARVIQACSDEGDLVMDPFLGSGTTGVIAHALKRRFIGCEYSAENAKRAFERIESGPIRPPDVPPPSSGIHKARGASTKVIDQFQGLAAAAGSEVRPKPRRTRTAKT